VRKSIGVLGVWARRSTALVGAAIVAYGLQTTPPVARAQDAAAPAAFTAPLAITNELLPFVVGAVKVYAGTERGVPVTLLERHLAETREFAWDGGTVSCRVIETIEFRRGAEEARQRVYVAQADDGSVWAFGETDDDSDEIEEEDDDDPGGWLVGTRGPSDPADAVEGARPGLLMPPAPRAGDEWTAEDAPPVFFKTNRVLAESEVVPTGAGRLVGCLRLREIDVLDESTETRWYAPGLGLVRTREPGERVALRASTIRPRR
jgi:hypothetical protein